MMGGALGGVEALFLPFEGAGFWPLISLGAILGGTMRSPFTGIVFAIELTHDLNALLPLLVANTIAYGVTVLLMKRSILTEKLSRRGFHLSREYSIDPLEILFVRDVMRTNVLAFHSDESIQDFAGRFRPDHSPRGQHLFPVVDREQKVVRVITRKDVKRILEEVQAPGATIGGVAHRPPIVAYANEPLRRVAYRMAEKQFTRMPVVDPEDGFKLVGMVSLEDLLSGRLKTLSEERARERVLRLRLPNRQKAPAD
jgi:CBS domain-containing protein